MSPAFSANVTEYTVNVANSVTAITVTGEANHVEAVVEGNVTGKTLIVGNNPIAITVTAEDGATAKTYTVTVVRDAPLTSAEISEALPARVYPNPTDDIVTLEFEASGVYNLTLMDITGKALLRQIAEGQTVQIDLSAYPAGIYLLMMSDGKRQSITRIVKN